MTRLLGLFFFAVILSAQYIPPGGSSGGSPTGAAGGSLAGTYPNPSLATLAQDLLFTDATYDIGKTGATRPRDIFLSRNLNVGSTATIGTTVVLDGTTNGLTVGSKLGGVTLSSLTGLAKWTTGVPGVTTTPDIGTATGTSLALTGAMNTGSGGGVTGTVKISGATSGTVTETVNAVAGTWTFTWPAAVPTRANSLLTATTTGVATWSDGMHWDEANDKLTLTDGTEQLVLRQQGGASQIYAASNPLSIITSGNQPMTFTTNNNLRATITGAGKFQLEDLKTTGAATGKTVVCVDTSTGQLYASTSGVACAN